MTYAFRQMPNMETKSAKLVSIEQADSWDFTINAKRMSPWPGVMACRTEQRGKQGGRQSIACLGTSLVWGIAERIHMDSTSTVMLDTFSQKCLLSGHFLPSVSFLTVTRSFLHTSLSHAGFSAKPGRVQLSSPQKTFNISILSDPLLSHSSSHL